MDIHSHKTMSTKSRSSVRPKSIVCSVTMVGQDKTIYNNTVYND